MVFVRKEQSTSGDGAARELSVPEFYANAVGIRISPFDVERGCMLVDGSGNTKGALNLRLSPQTALSLAGALSSQLREYEERFGKIALPADLQQ